MYRVSFVFLSLFMLAGALVGCGDDDGTAGSGGTSGSGGSGGTGGTAIAEGSVCDTTSECVDGLTCVPTGVTSVDPMFCARGCDRQDQCATGERCSTFCDPSEAGCTANPAYCATLVTTAWAPCGFSITATCGDTVGGAVLTCLVTDTAGSLGFCVRLCEFNTVGQCSDGEVCSAEILGSSTTGVCATPRARGEACHPLAGDVCASTDFCASLTDASGAGTCRQLCGGTTPACDGVTECVQFATFNGVPVSACFPTSGGNQDGGV
jgi:hypothetical protein